MIWGPMWFFDKSKLICYTTYTLILLNQTIIINLGDTIMNRQSVLINAI